ncbi:MAG TPA: BatD family protein, partial [Bacteroidales bacterium]|nr:BatD family protein [Bacteroidales bacterium]
NEEFEEFDIPEIRDFQFLGGPSTGHSRSVSSVNGKITTISTYQYTYFFRATKEGKFTIPSATATIKGKAYRSNPITVEVLKAAASSSRSSGTSGTGSQQSAPGENELFVRVILDKRDAYIGEQIIATFKVYTSQTNLSGIDPNFKGPDFTGFFTELIETPQPRGLQREAVDGDLYYTAVIRRMVIIPQKSGELTIDPFDLDVAIRKEVRRRIADPLFEDFVIPDIEDIPVKLTSRPVKINVKSLPVNAPVSFKGAVGNFRLNATLNKTSTSTNDPLTLRVSITGKGNLKLINEVDVNVPYDMERFDPVINTRFDNSLAGTKTFEFLIVPKVQGNFTIPPVEFTYFDTEAGQYKTLRSESYDVAVIKSGDDSLLAVAPGISKEDVRLLNTDIRFIETKPPRLNYINRFIATSPWYYFIYVIALTLFSSIIALRKKIVRQNADIAGMRFRKADKYARKRLKKSEGLLRQGNDSAFYEEMLGAIWGYLSHKLGIPVASLSKETAETNLLTRFVDEDIIQQLFRITETCENARYGFGSAETDRQKLYHDAVKVITALQQKLK